jgi:hypothetical protein
MLNIFNGYVWCPWCCCGNGQIYKTFVIALKRPLYVCYECGATWEFFEEIEQPLVRWHFSDYLGKYGLDALSADYTDPAKTISGTKKKISSISEV